MSTKFFTDNTSDTLISKFDEVKVIDPDLPLRRLEDEGCSIVSDDNGRLYIKDIVRVNPRTKRIKNGLYLAFGELINTLLFKSGPIYREKNLILNSQLINNKLFRYYAFLAR